MNTPSRLKELRESRGLSQEQLADALNVDRTTIVKYETGASNPTRNLQKIANFYNVSTDYILCRTDNPSQNISLGEYLRMARQHVAYSPEYVAGITGINADTLIAWEKNAEKPSKSELETLAKCYHVSVAILTGKDTQIDSRMIRPILSAEENLAADLFHRFGGVLKALAGMSPAKQEQAASYIAFLAQDDKKA